MKHTIPILVPIKKMSRRCPDKNLHLLPYTAKYLNSAGLGKNTWVISDSRDLLSLAEKYMLNTFSEKIEANQNEKNSCWKFLQKNHFDEFILCPVTQPFRDLDLIDRAIEKYLQRTDSIDFVTSITEISDRRQFYVEKGVNSYVFSHQFRNRKGATSPEVNVLDGSLYLIKTAFLKSVVSKKNQTDAFWAGRFDCIHNTVPFMDIDTVNDYVKFKFLNDYFSSFD